MMYRDLDKQVIKENSYTVLSKITLLNDGTVYTEEDSIIDWNYEDYRYVPDTGFVGQFVERLLDGNLQDIPDDKIFENQEINLQIGIVNGIDDITTWYDYGNFLITKVEETDTSGNYKFESSDYTKKFNQVYEDTIAYPCLSLDLANNVCGQVDITMDTKNNADYYIVGEEGLSAGDYAFKVGTTYYKFTTTSDLVKNDVLMLIEYYNRLYVKTVRYDEETGYTVARTFLTFTTGDTVGDYSLLTTRSTGYVDFTNNDFVIENNQYEEQDTCRKVMQDIGKLAYSWVRIGVDNKLYIDFNQMSQASVDDYDKLTTNEYYVSKKQDLYYGPVNKVLIGMSSVDGENLYETSEDYTEETECAIKIYDNNLTYTEELRAIALKGCERLFGLTYMPLEIETIGHPWLEGNELIKLTNLDGEELYTYPFNRSIKYSGYIEGNISSEAATIKNSEYEYESGIINQINKTTIIVDKNNQTITSLVSQVGDAESNITELQQTTTGLTASVNYLNEEYEKNVVIKKDAEGNPIEIEDGGSYPLEDFKIYGNCEQDGEPSTSNPVEIKTVTSKTTTENYEGTDIDIDCDYDTNDTKVEKSDLELEGDTTQETTSGKNLYKLGTITTTESNGVTFTPVFENNKLQYINVNGTATANTFYNFERITMPAGSYIANGCTGGTSSTYQIGINFGSGRLNVVNGDLSFTLTEEKTMTESFIRVQSGTTVNNVKIYPMIRLSSITDATYEPYTNGPTPNPQYPQPINVATGLQDVNVSNGIDSNTYSINLGKQLLDDTYNYGSVTNTTIDNEHWCTATYDNTSGSSAIYCNNYTRIPTGITIEPSSTYYVYFEVKNVSTTGTNSRITISNNNASFVPNAGITNIMLNTLSNNTIYKYTITTKADLSGVVGLLRTNVNVASGESVSITYRLTFTKSDIPIDRFIYSPYFLPIELCKIGTYQDRIFKSSGKNLFDKDNITLTNGFINADLKVFTTSATSYTFTISCKPNTTYTIHKIASARFRVGTSEITLSNNSTFTNATANDSGTSITITSGANDKYLSCLYYNSNYDTTITQQQILDSIMINEGTTPLPYEPYGTNKWYLYKTIGKETFTGSQDESWRKTTDTSASVFVTNISGRNTSLSSSSICNYFKYQFANIAGKFYFSSSSSDGCAFCMETTYDLESFKTWLGTHNTSVYYVLEIPTCTEITDTTLINELESVSNFTLYSPLTHYTTTSEDLPTISKFSVSTLPYEVISITDENDNKLTYKPLFRNLELCKISDYQDYLYLKQGKWYKHEEIGKILSYNGETITTDYISTTGELSTGATVYYVLQDTREIEITDEEVITELNRLMQNNINKGYNKISLNDPVCEKLAITYLTDSILNDTYASKAQLSMTNNSISALVQQTNSLESNLASLNIDVDGISTAVESVETVTTNLENSINYLAVDMSANSLIIPTNEENKPYLTNTYTIPFTATFKGTSVNPTVTTSSASVTGITLSFGTGVINVAVSSATAIANLSNSFVINFSYTSDAQSYVVSKTLNVALSVKGEDGKDGTSVTILGSYNTLADLQAAHPTGNAGDSYMVGNDLYVWNVASLAWVDVGQIKGTDGINSYIYIRYSENPDGNPMVTTPTSTTQYIGVVTTTSSTAPTSYSSYTWSKYAGNNGETTYLHIKYSEDGSTFVPASEDADEGDTPSAWVGVLTDTNEEASDEFDDYTWYKFTEDIDDDLLRLQNDIVQNASDIDSNYKAIMKNFDSYATADTVATLKSRVETLETDDAYAINIIRDLQVNGVSQVRTEKGFTFNDSGMTIDATNSVTKSITDTNGITVLDKSGSSQSELLFAGYDETSQSSVVRTENLKVRKFLTIGTYSRLEDYEDGTGVFDV